MVTIDSYSIIKVSLSYTVLTQNGQNVLQITTITILSKIEIGPQSLVQIRQKELDDINYDIYQVLK